LQIIDLMEYKLEELIDIPQFQSILDKLNEIYSFPSAIIDNEGNVLTATAWQDICTKFHRVNSKSDLECIKSDKYIAEHLAEANPSISYNCPHGMVDNAIPIIINGKHIANFFTGQLFLEKPDLEFFKNQAKKYGFEEESYLEAVRKVPIWTKEKLDLYLLFIKSFTEMIAKLGYERLREIESRKLIEQKEKELSESENKFRAIFENSQDAIGVSKQGINVFLNPAYISLFGYDSGDELIGKPILEQIAPQARTKIIDYVGKRARGEEMPTRYETIGIRKNGDEFHFEIRVDTYIMNNEKYTIAIIRDITDKKISVQKLEEQNEEYEVLNEELRQTNQELEEAIERVELSERKLRLKNNELKERNFFIQTILDNLPIGLALNKFNEGEATYMNKKFEEIYGWTAQEITSISTFFENIYPDTEYRKSITDRILSDIGSGDPNKMHWENIMITRKDGSKRIVNSVNIPLIEQNTMVSTVMDITELKQIQNDLVKSKEKAEESERLKTAFLQNMSHEIRTPLNAIVGFSKLLENHGISDEKKKSYTKIISNSSNQLLTIVSDILTISSLETKQEKIIIQNVNINNIILELLTTYNLKANSQNISFYSKKQLSDLESEIYTDKSKITQILTILLSNALKFTHKGFVEFGYTLVEMDGRPSQQIQFYVKDTGIGINPEEQNKIFERFRQADFSISQKYGGTGLGLSISKGFIELLGGKIWVESEPEKGSTFFFSIPYNPVHQFDKIETNSPKPKNIKTILVAEDAEYNYQFIEELLTELDFKIIHAKDGKETVEICKTNHDIDLILMDIKMPIMDGYTAAKLIKEFKPDLPIIAQSAYALEHEKQKFNEIFDDYVTKPIDKDELIGKVMNYMKGRNI